MEEIAWLDEAVQRVKEKYQTQRALEERSAQEETRKRALGAQFSRDLFAWFERMEESFNSKFGGHLLAVSVVGAEGNRSVKVLANLTRNQERMAVLTYNNGSNDNGSNNNGSNNHPVSLGLRFGSDATAEVAQTIKLVPSNNGTVLAEFGAEHYSYEQLGQKIIDDLLA
jgi:hypothetical protein